VRRLNIDLSSVGAHFPTQYTNRSWKPFYSVSHDLRPLGGIDGYGGAAEDHKDRWAKKRYCLGVAQSRHVGQLIDDCCACHACSHRNAPVCMVRWARLSPVGAETQPDREVIFSIAPGVTGEADPALLRVALENLLRNAWKFTAKHPSAHIEFGCLEQDGETVYYVSDDGAGFDMAYANKLFGAFQRLHSPEEFEGSGIGLALVQRIIHRHGGRVWGEGVVKQGATFYFTLPGAGP
jgi:light-regulated signal transduction histidine kinase (bacteriophytochrome)